MENHYVGLDRRIAYILEKAGNDPCSRERISGKKEETRQLMEEIEKNIGQTVDSLFQTKKEKKEEMKNYADF